MALALLVCAPPLLSFILSHGNMSPVTVMCHYHVKLPVGSRLEDLTFVHSDFFLARSHEEGCKTDSVRFL